jgi:hypothetical protein
VAKNGNMIGGWSFEYHGTNGTIYTASVFPV